MRLAIELLLSVLRSNKGGMVTINYLGDVPRPWQVSVTIPSGRTYRNYNAEGDLPYQAAARCYDQWSKAQ